MYPIKSQTFQSIILLLFFYFMLLSLCQCVYVCMYVCMYVCINEMLCSIFNIIGQLVLFLVSFMVYLFKFIMKCHRNVHIYNTSIFIICTTIYISHIVGSHLSKHCILFQNSYQNCNITSNEEFLFNQVLIGIMNICLLQPKLCTFQ